MFFVGSKTWRHLELKTRPLRNTENALIMLDFETRQMFDPNFTPFQSTIFPPCKRFAKVYWRCLLQAVSFIINVVCIRAMICILMSPHWPPILSQQCSNHEVWLSVVLLKRLASSLSNNAEIPGCCDMVVVGPKPQWRMPSGFLCLAFYLIWHLFTTFTWQ